MNGFCDTLARGRGFFISQSWSFTTNRPSFRLPPGKLAKEFLVNVFIQSYESRKKVGCLFTHPWWRKSHHG